MSFWEDDAGGFFNDFGEPALLQDGTEITVIFDAAYQTASPMGVDIESSKPMAMAKSTDVENEVHGNTITIRGTIYMIVGIQPDGTGMTNLILSE
jgi:hypothetical protein